MNKFHALLIIVFLFNASILLGQTLHLGGDIHISLSESRINSEFYLTNFSEAEVEFTFMLNDDIKVKSATKKEEKLSLISTTKGCYDCRNYTATFPNSLKPEDTIRINTVGKFNSFKPGSNTNDYKGIIANNYGILRASEQSKWYPVVADGAKNAPSFLKIKPSTYSLSVNCSDCENVYVGQGRPLPMGGNFTGTDATKDVMLIAGQYKWKEGDKAIYINVENDKLVEKLDSLFTKISGYYEGLIKITMPSKFTYAYLPSDNEQWGGFMTYPTIVNVNQQINTQGLEQYLSHEIAHYLFGVTFESQSNLFWFYLESFAEFFSYKYLLAHDPTLLKNSFERLKGVDDFVRLDQIDDFDEVTNRHRYTTGPFQLLAIENKIG